MAVELFYSKSTRRNRAEGTMPLTIPLRFTWGLLSPDAWEDDHTFDGQLEFSEALCLGHSTRNQEMWLVWTNLCYKYETHLNLWNNIIHLINASYWFHVFSIWGIMTFILYVPFYFSKCGYWKFLSCLCGLHLLLRLYFYWTVLVY